MDAEKDVALENLDRGFQESKNMQIIQFLNDQAEISNRLKTFRFKENPNNNGVYNPDSRVSTAPEAATRTHRLRPLSARPSTASGRQYQEPDVEREVDIDSMSVSGRRKSAVRRHPAENSSSSSSSPVQRPETVCGFYDLDDVEEETEQEMHEVESDLDVLSVESITSTGPCDDIDDEDVDGVTYEFDVPESDQRHIEAEVCEKSGSNIGSVSPVPGMNSRMKRYSTGAINSPTRVTSPTRIKSSKHRTSVPNIGASSSNNSLTRSLPIEPHPPSSRLGLEQSDSNSTTTVLRHMRSRTSSTELRERGKVRSLSKGFVWGDPSTSNELPTATSSHHFRPPSEHSPLAAATNSMSPRISFEEIPIEKQGMTLRTVARIDCDAAFYRKLRHRSAPAMRSEELTTSRSEGNSPVRAKPFGIYHLPPLSKETSLPASSSKSSAHGGVRTITPSEILTQVPQHKIVFQEPNILH